MKKHLTYENFDIYLSIFFVFFMAIVFLVFGYLGSDKYKINKCKEIGASWYSDCGRIKCVNEDEKENLKKFKNFEKCTEVCENLFYEQANTWGNGSESQSIEANKCVDNCLKNIK